VKEKEYCTQNGGDCVGCPLASFGRDCHGILIMVDNGGDQDAPEAGEGGK
jgi:hypothetical protein